MSKQMKCSSFNSCEPSYSISKESLVSISEGRDRLQHAYIVQEGVASSPTSCFPKHGISVAKVKIVNVLIAATHIHTHTHSVKSLYMLVSEK